MKKLSNLLFLLMLLPLTANAQQQWTLRECIDYALTHNISLQKKRLSRLSATEDLRQSEAALLPSLSASTNQSVGYRPWTGSGVTTVSNGTVNTSVKKTYYNGSYGLNAQWTVWNGNRNRNQVKLNRLTEEQEKTVASALRRSREDAEEYLRLYGAALPDRGGEGQLVSYFETTLVYIDAVAASFRGAEIVPQREVFDEPPMPDPDAR